MNNLLNKAIATKRIFVLIILLVGMLGFVPKDLLAKKSCGAALVECIKDSGFIIMGGSPYVALSFQGFCFTGYAFCKEFLE